MSFIQLIITVFIWHSTFYNSYVFCYNSCLHYRSICLRNETCHSYLRKFQTSCNFDLNTCTGDSPSDCVYYLRNIRNTFPTETCTCYQSVGFSEECDYFRQLIWNHPCERKMRDIGEEMVLTSRYIHHSHRPENGLKRTTRTPIADQVQQWKTQLSGELTRVSLQQRTCDSALYEICLKHVSCSQLWAMFRRNCDVDQDNKCQMSDREVCWQSFEGLTWTGLGDCNCAASNSSDCHWIRLHTNYNKCIYEISKSGQFPSLLTLSARQNQVEEYRRRYENRETHHSHRPKAMPTTTSTTTTTTTTSTSTTTTTRRPPTTTTTTIPPMRTTTTVPSWWNAPRRNTNTVVDEEKDKVQYTHAIERENGRTNSFKLKAVVGKEEHRGPKKESLTKFVAKKSSARSSCPDALKRCESFEECKWQLSELRVKCPPTSSCQRDECEASVHRFTQYVPTSLTEALMFCHCASGDQDCLLKQEVIYPSCLYKTVAGESTPSCTKVAKRCDSDPRCQRLRTNLASACPVHNGVCMKTTGLDNCRKVLALARATALEQPCTCTLGDLNCLAIQNSLIPGNPCIENAMLEYSRIYGYDRPPTSSNRVRDTIADIISTRSTVVVAAPLPPWKEEPKKTSYSVVEEENDENRIQVDTMEMTTIKPYEQEKMLQTQTESYQAPIVKKAPTTTTTTTMTPMAETTKKPGFFSSIIEKLPFKDKLRQRTTMEPPVSTESPPPWDMTTMGPGVATTTTVFTTQPPPPPEGCTMRDANGRWIFLPVGSVFRKYGDWSGRCSSWCQCLSENNMTCQKLPCHAHGTCEGPLKIMEFGEPVYLNNRGPCICQSDSYVCERSETQHELYPGLYLAIGYSLKDIQVLKEKVPVKILNRAGFSSVEPADDIASRMQNAFDQILKGVNIRCRIVTMSELNEPGNAFYRIEWFGKEPMMNHTKAEWQSDGSQKICSPYVHELAGLFQLHMSPRFQLALSTVKQVGVIDTLSAIPTSYSTSLTGQYLSIILIFRYFLITLLW